MPRPFRERIGKRIHAARVERGYSQNELARALNAAGAPTITAGQVSRWERGKALPTEANIAALERLLGVLC